MFSFYEKFEKPVMISHELYENINAGKSEGGVG